MVLSDCPVMEVGQGRPHNPLNPGSPGSDDTIVLYRDGGMIRLNSCTSTMSLRDFEYKECLNLKIIQFFLNFVQKAFDPPPLSTHL